EKPYALIAHVRFCVGVWGVIPISTRESFNYVIFAFMIRRFDFKTPECEDDDTETKLYTKADVNVRKEAGKIAG
uniref:hypothetical protein n=1 Tax=Blautia wexlerae TaxID=418240 RepID=UPI0034A28B4A